MDKVKRKHKELVAERNKIKKQISKSKSRLEEIEYELKILTKELNPKLTVLLCTYCDGTCQETTEDRIVGQFKNYKSVTKKDIKSYLHRCFPDSYGSWETDSDEDSDDCDDIETTIQSMIKAGSLIKIRGNTFKIAKDVESNENIGSVESVENNQANCRCHYPEITFQKNGNRITMTTRIGRSYKDTECQILYNGINFIILNLKTGRFLEWTCESGGSGIEETKYYPELPGYSLIHQDTRKNVTIEDFYRANIPFTATNGTLPGRNPHGPVKISSDEGSSTEGSSDDSESDESESDEVLQKFYKESLISSSSESDSDESESDESSSSESESDD